MSSFRNEKKKNVISSFIFQNISFHWWIFSLVIFLTLSRLPNPDNFKETPEIWEKNLRIARYKLLERC